MKKLSLKALKVESFVTTPEEKEVKGGQPAPSTTCVFTRCIEPCSLGAC